MIYSDHAMDTNYTSRFIQALAAMTNDLIIFDWTNFYPKFEKYNNNLN